MARTKNAPETDIVVEPVSTDFSILELEDRLEFTEICDTNCKCEPAPKPTAPAETT